MSPPSRGYSFQIFKWKENRNFCNAERNKNRKTQAKTVKALLSTALTFFFVWVVFFFLFNIYEVIIVVVEVFHEPSHKLEVTMLTMFGILSPRMLEPKTRKRLYKMTCFKHRLLYWDTYADQEMRRQQCSTKSVFRLELYSKYLKKCVKCIDYVANIFFILTYV